MADKLTLENLLYGDTPATPRREGKGEIKWWEVQSVAATNIFYEDFQVNKGELTIGYGNAVFKADSLGIYLGNSIWAYAPFRVDMSGNAYLENASVSGSITATSGTIGGFTVTATELYGGSIKTSQDVGEGESGVIMDDSGLRGYSNLLGETFNLPTDGSAPTFSSGVINNTIFEINTNSVIRTSDTVGDGTVNSAGVLVNNTGIYACSEYQTLADANVRILATGEATFSGNVKGGMLDFMSGVGYFMGYSGDAYKMSVGDPDNSYIAWDGEQLQLKGLMELDGPLNLEGYETIDLPIPPSNPGLMLAGGYS